MMSTSSLLIMTLVNAIRVYNILIFARVILSWIIQDPNNPIYRFLYGITEPILGPLRRVIPTTMLDLSPIVAYLLLSIIAKMLLSII